MEKNIFERYESNVRSYCRKYPAVFCRSQNDMIFDEQGQGYIDFLAGCGALNYGHNNPAIKEQVVKYILADGITHSMDMYTRAKQEFIQTFEEKILQPRGLDYKIMFAGPTGTNANEAALKLARKVTGRTNIFALMGCFHGMTLGSLAMTTEDAARRGAGVPLGTVTHIPAPYMFEGLDSIAYMEQLIQDDHSGVEKPAALVVEAVQAEGGIYPLPAEWLQRARKFCDDNDILLIADEVQVGCGRTGTYFGFEQAQIQPDIVTLAKSIGGMGMPMAMVLFHPELDQWSPGEHNGTFRGFQYAMVAGKAGIDYVLANDVLAETTRKGAMVEVYLDKELPQYEHRGVGLIYGIDFGGCPAGTAKRISQSCFTKGLIIELAGREDAVLKILPPLTITDEHLRQGLDIIKQSVAEVLG